MPSPLPGFDDNVEFAMEPIYGFRLFFTNWHEGLSSLNWPYTWHPGPNKDFCFTMRTVQVVESFDVLSFDGNMQAPIRTRTSETEEREIGWDTHDMFNCSCGFYAYHDMTSLMSQYGDLIDLDSTAVGVIKVTGKVVLGTKGFRGEVGELVALTPPRGMGSSARQLDMILQMGYLYGVPVYDRSVDMRRDWPSTFGRDRGYEPPRYMGSIDIY